VAIVLNFSLSVFFRFCLYGADGNNGDGCEHHHNMFHSKESYFAHVHGITKVVKEIADNRTDEIKSNSKNKLDVSDRCSGMANRVIKFCKRLMISPTSISTINCLKLSWPAPTNETMSEELKVWSTF